MDTRKTHKTRTAKALAAKQPKINRTAVFENEPNAWSVEDLRDTLTEICAYHAPLQHGFEVAWALWMARSLKLALPDCVSFAVRKLDDDVVALVALDMEHQGLLPPIDSRLWAGRMTPDDLYSDHWLIAYEALVQGWLPPVEGIDYVALDPFFSILQTGNVRFYNVDEPWEEGYSDYSDGDEDEDEDDEDEDDEEGADDLPNHLEELHKHLSPEGLPLVVNPEKIDL